MVGRVTGGNVFSRKAELLWEIAVGQESHQGIRGLGARQEKGGGGETEAFSFVPCISHESTPGGGVICKYTSKELCFQKRGLNGNPLIPLRCPSTGKGALGITLLRLTFPPAQGQGFPEAVWRIGGGSKDTFSEGGGQAEQIPREEQLPLPLDLLSPSAIKKLLWIN